MRALIVAGVTLCLGCGGAASLQLPATAPSASSPARSEPSSAAARPAPASPVPGVAAPPPPPAQAAAPRSDAAARAGDTPAAAVIAAQRAAAASAAAPALRPGGALPASGWLYSQVRAWRQYPCEANADKSDLVRVDVTVGLRTIGKHAALHVVVHRKEGEDSRCSFSGGSSGMLRVSFEGESTLRGARRVYRFKSWHRGELPLGQDEFTRVENGASTLALDCGAATVAASAYEADDDDENSAGFSSDLLPGVPVVACKLTGSPLEHALFEQWLYRGQLLLARAPGMELRSTVVEGMDATLALRVGSTGPGYAIQRQRVGDW